MFRFIMKIEFYVIWEKNDLFCKMRFLIKVKFSEDFDAFFFFFFFNHIICKSISDSVSSLAGGVDKIMIIAKSV